MISIVIPSLPGYGQLNRHTVDSFHFSAHPQTNIEILLIENDRPFAANVNQGLRDSKGDIILVANNDVQALPGWDKWLLEAPTGIVSMTNRPDCGWAWGMKREVVEQIGFLDETLVNSYDDYDYFIRAALLGYNRVLAPRFFMIHQGGHTLNKIWGTVNEAKDIRLRTCHRNREYMLSKWPGIDIDSVPLLHFALRGAEIMAQWKQSCNRS